MVCYCLLLLKQDRMTLKKIEASFFMRDVLEVAPELPGKYLVIGNSPYRITEVEAYRCEEDLACHASRGRTARTEIMYREGGHLYIYLIYGMYWMLNIVTAPEGIPQAALIRGIEGYDGPGKLTRHLKIDKSFNGEHICHSERIWLAGSHESYPIDQSPRIGIDYAGEPWVSKPWRYSLRMLP